MMIVECPGVACLLCFKFVLLLELLSYCCGVNEAACFMTSLLRDCLLRLSICNIHFKMQILRGTEY